MADDTLTVLRSIDATLKALLDLSQRRSKTSAQPGAQPQALTVASDADLDGKYGDPIIKATDPRDWTGPTMKGRRFSECPAEYLDLVADRLEYFARKADENDERLDNGKPASGYKRLDAARARGWAARIRAGTHKPATSDASKWGDY